MDGCEVNLREDLFTGLLNVQGRGVRKGGERETGYGGGEGFVRGQAAAQ